MHCTPPVSGSDFTVVPLHVPWSSGTIQESKVRTGRTTTAGFRKKGIICLPPRQVLQLVDLRSRLTLRSSLNAVCQGRPNWLVAVVCLEFTLVVRCCACVGLHLHQERSHHPVLLGPAH